METDARAADTIDLRVDLRGRRALVTGGATGIGRAISAALIDNGAAVAVGYRASAAAARELTARAGDAPVAAVAADLSDAGQVERLCTEAAARLGGPIDILVNNAGDVLDRRPLVEAPLSAWHGTLALDLTAVMLTCRLLAPAMRERGWGRIINVSSISARTGGGGGATAYVAAKGGVEALTRSLARELGADGITVNAVAPGVILTAIHRSSTPEALEALRLTTAARRLGRPADCAGAVLFLASEAASYVTGSTIPVNGGMRMD